MKRLTDRAYQLRVSVAMTLYVVAMLGVWPVARAAPALWLKASLTLVPVVPMLYVIGLLARKIAQSDELEQRTHLVGLGVGHIAYIGHTNSRAAPRIEGFRAALRGAHLDIALLHSVEGTTEMEEGLAVVDTVLDQLPQCDAMVFGTDVMAAGALLRLQDVRG